VAGEYVEDAMNTFFEKLANSSLPGQTSEHLKLLGKRAAGNFMRKEAENLNEAVASVVQEENLNKDQVRRVAEMANQATWKELFHEGGERDTVFDPADAESVLGELSSTPDAVYDDARSLDYYNDVPNQTQDVDWEETFGVKEGTPEYEALSQTGEEESDLKKVASEMDLARYGIDKLSAELAVAGEEFYQMVKQAHLNDDLGVLQISKAVGQAVQDPAFAQQVMTQAAGRLQSEGVRFREEVELQKVAHPLVVNTEHPLMQKAAILEKLAYTHYRAKAEHGELQKKHRRATRALRDKLRGT
jgi:hypothetical protein